jgi:hypothetical protein
MEITRVQVHEIPARGPDAARVSMVLGAMGAAHCFEMDPATARVLGQMLLSRAEKLGAGDEIGEAATHCVEGARK